MLVHSKEEDCVNLNIYNCHNLHYHHCNPIKYTIKNPCVNDDDLLVIDEEEEGVVCDKLGVDQWSGRPEPGHSTI